MTPTTLARIALAVVALPLATPAPAAEKAANPVYQSWERFSQGTSIVHKPIYDTSMNKYEVTMTYTLVERTRDKVVVEMQVTTRVNGVETRNRPMKMDNPRAIPLPPGAKAPPAGKIEGMTDQGEEIVKIAGREVKAKWYKARNKVEGNDNFTRSWSSDEVPGGLVKSVTTTPGNKSSMLMELVEIKAP